MSIKTTAAPLRHRDFRNLFISRFVSMTGDGLTSVALAFAVYEMTGDASDVGIILAVRSIPTAALVLLGGVLGDRLPRRTVLVSSEAACGLTQLGLAALLWTGTHSLAALAALAAAYGVALAFFYPASTGITPQTVPEELLQQANGLLSLGKSAGFLVGPAVGGLLVAALSPATAIALDSLTFLLSAWLLSRLSIAHAAAEIADSTVVSEFVNGWRFVRSTPWLATGLLYFVPFQLLVLSSLYVLGPAAAVEHYDGPKAWGVVLTVFGAGTVLGGFVVLRIKVERPLLTAFLVLIGTMPAMLLLSIGAPLVALYPVVLVYGVAVAVGGVLWDTSLQAFVPNDRLSRVSSFEWLSQSTIRPLGFAAVGPIAAVVGMSTVFATAGVYVVVAGLLMALIPSVRSHRTKTDAPSVPA